MDLSTIICRHILCIIFNYSTIEVKQMRCFGSNCSDIDWPRKLVCAGKSPYFTIFRLVEYNTYILNMFSIDMMDIYDFMIIFCMQSNTHWHVFEVSCLSLTCVAYKHWSSGKRRITVSLSTVKAARATREELEEICCRSIRGLFGKVVCWDVETKGTWRGW